MSAAVREAKVFPSLVSKQSINPATRQWITTAVGASPVRGSASSSGYSHTCSPVSGSKAYGWQARTPVSKCCRIERKSVIGVTYEKIPSLSWLTVSSKLSTHSDTPRGSTQAIFIKLLLSRSTSTINRAYLPGAIAIDADGEE